MRKTTTLLLVLAILSVSFFLMPLLNVSAPGPPVLLTWEVVVATTAGVLVLVTWSMGLGILNITTVGKPPPADYSFSDDDLNTDSTDYPDNLLTSLIVGNMVGIGHNYPGQQSPGYHMPDTQLNHLRLNWLIERDGVTEHSEGSNPQPLF